MASQALRQTPLNLTDWWTDIVTRRPQVVPSGLVRTETSDENSAIELRMETGKEQKRIRLTVPKLPRPEWLVPSLKRAVQLLSLPLDNRRQRSPVDPLAIQSAFDALYVLMSSNSSLPQWTPTQRAGVQLDWHEKNIDLEIAFEPGESTGYAVFEDLSSPGLEWDGPVTPYRAELQKLFRERLVR